MPARFAPIVNMSLRYIASGSSTFSPSVNGSDGDDRHHQEVAALERVSYSRRMRVRARCACR